MSHVLHIVPEFNKANGVFVVANMLAGEDGGLVVDAHGTKLELLRRAEEVWVHCMWLPCEWRACFWTLLFGKRLVRMTHACVDPVRLKYHGWKKWLVGPIERFFLRRAKVVVATCEAEKGWIESYLGRRCPPIVLTDIRRFFHLESPVPRPTSQSDNASNSKLQTLNSKLNLLYLGRCHPLKGLSYLESAIREFQEIGQTSNLGIQIELKVVSNVFGEEKERIWDWCDVLVLPTLSDNFGLVIAEALERGKRVITTDGAPAWGDGNDYGGRLIYLKGFRDGTPEERVRLLRDAIGSLSL